MAVTTQSKTAAIDYQGPVIGDVFNVVVPCYGQTSEDADTCVEFLPGDQVRFAGLSTHVSGTAWVQPIGVDLGADMVMVSWPSIPFEAAERHA